MVGDSPRHKCKWLESMKSKWVTGEAPVPTVKRWPLSPPPTKHTVPWGVGRKAQWRGQSWPALACLLHSLPCCSLTASLRRSCRPALCSSYNGVMPASDSPSSRSPVHRHHQHKTALHSGTAATPQLQLEIFLHVQIQPSVITATATAVDIVKVTPFAVAATACHRSNSLFFIFFLRGVCWLYENIESTPASGLVSRDRRHCSLKWVSCTLICTSMLRLA